MAMKDKILVVGSQRYEGMIDGKSIRTGKIFTLSKCVADGDHFGLSVGTFSVGYDNVENYKTVPAYYDVDFDFVGAKVCIVGAKLVSTVLDILPTEKNTATK